MDRMIQRNVIALSGNRGGMADDEGLKKYRPLDIINNILLDGMKVVGELFGSGQMQLPFVLQSAEAMKASVGYLENFMDKADATSKGTMVIATVKGDVHDIGKNLVDIILTNNGYKVINLGIQCPLERMLTAYDEHKADAIGMSGLLVKSTLIMKENLAVMNERDVHPPVILGGAALPRRYVEGDLRSMYKGNVFYANDAFDGLHFMEQLAAGKSAGKPTNGRSAALPDVTVAVENETGDANALSGLEAKIALAPKSTAMVGKNVAAAVIPKAPFYGSKVVENISLDEVFPYINEVALIRGQWQVRKGKLSEADYRNLLDSEIYPDLERLKRLAKNDGLLQPKIVYGYFPCQSDGDDLVIYDPAEGSHLTELLRFTFPRQTKGRYFCISDFFAPKESGNMDVVAFHLVTMGKVASEHTQKLFASNNYKEYLYFHGLSVESAEALAELWHKKIREEMGIAQKDSPDIKKLFSQQYQGSRYSFGYAACPSLEDQAKLFELLHPERIGVELTEEYQLVPEQSTSAIIVHHPDAKYFNV